MAAASPSPLVSSVEKTNGAKLSRLLIDGGTMVLRKIFDRYHPPANLLANLNVHYHTLNNLLRRRVLYKPQWDLLFPPGGAIPDSNTFDITLLFLLLTNICGLSPPPSGWHTKPAASDTSVEANIARIKFFRNELYGHVTTTGIDTPTFSSLWLEISAVLVALGLPQAEINRLKAEHCGEEDFLDVLFEWADSEEDIKSQLKGMCQSRAKTGQTVVEVRQTQIEDRKILQDSKRKLEEVHEVQTKTQQTVDDVRQSQTKTQQTVDEVRQSQTKTQQTVDEVRQSQTKTQQTVDEVRQSLTKTQQTVHEIRQYQIKTRQTVDAARQNQLEDRGTVQGGNAKLQEVFQMDKKTHEVVRNIRDTQIDDSKAIQDIRHTQHEFHKTLQETKSRVDKIQQTHEKLLRTQDEDLEGQNEHRRENEILKKLAKIDTLKNVRQHRDRYIEGTRLSIFAKVESWFNDRSSPNRVMVISGNAGMGKSVISAVMCKKMQDAGRLAGSHFCQHDRARHRNPKVMLQSLASQLCDILPDYKEALVEKLSRNLGVEVNNMEVKDLFEVLFEEPLTSLNDPGLTYLMVIDGLDESEFQGRNELLDVVANYFQNIPLWIRFLVTTRPERNIAETLQNFHPLQLDPNVEENVRDIHLFFEKQLSHLLQSDHRENILQALVQKSEGLMLYAHYLVDFIKKEVPLLTSELMDSILPSDVSSVYESYFKRLETELCKEVNATENQFLTFLSAVAAAREPLPLGFVSKLLLSVISTSVLQRKVKAAIACVSALLPVQDECIHFFHKSVKDWLIDKCNYEQHHFSVDEKEGHKVLSELCIDELDDVKQKGVTCAKFSDTTKYALRHGVQHLLQQEDARVCSLEDVVEKFVLDLELVYAKLCVNVTAAFEDIVCAQKLVGMEELQKALNTLLVLLRKHIATLEKVPHAIFQTLWNEGGPVLSSQALNLLETKYSEMAYVEYLHKEDLQGRIQAKFRCSAAVACFDVSPQLDYMVCECDDNTIQLWSLHTGKQLWKRNVKVAKDYYCRYDRECGDLIYEPYRATKNFDFGSYYGIEDLSCPLKSLYRSVVFHPTEDLVLPGILSHAYTFHGELRPLFLSSKCRFSVCSISADKTKMLTDCTSDAKPIIMWSLTDGSEINRFAWSNDIVSFAWSRNERLLAVSDFRGSISLRDVMDDFRILAQTTFSGVCGMIRFSPDCQSLYCFNTAWCDIFPRDLFRLDVKMENDGGLSLSVLHDEVSYQPWEFESCSERGFLLGDPFCLPPKRGPIYSWSPTLAFVLNKQCALRVASSWSIIEMLQLDELTKESAGDSETVVMNAVLSLNGDRLFIITITVTDANPVLMGWDISSGMFKPAKIVPWTVGFVGMYNLVAVREGVLLQTSDDTLELWDFELSECIRSWNELKDISKVISISEDQVACKVDNKVITLDTARTEVKNKVFIVDTGRKGLVSTITFHGEFVACTSKCHVITTDRQELQMQCGDVVLWKRSVPFERIAYYHFEAFSPTEQYCILASSKALYVLDVASGRTLRTLQLRIHEGHFPKSANCKFVSDEECVACNPLSVSLTGYFLQLFNVKSGDPLSEITLESPVYSLAACPRERLVAIGFGYSKVNFKVLQVKLPRDKHSRKSKRIKPKE